MLLKAFAHGFGKPYPTDVFVLGAGFSRTIADQMPTMAELSTRVVQRLGSQLRDKVLPEFARRNIEVALAFLRTRHPWLTEGEYHRRLGEAYDMLAAIGDVIDELEHKVIGSGGGCPDWLRRLVYWLHDEQASIITFNYDTLLERAFCEIPIADISGANESITLNPKCLSRLWFPPDEYESKLGVPWPSADLLKLHGSVNWFYSGAAQYYGEVFQYRKVARWGQTVRYGLMGNAEKVPLIVPPVSDKSTYFEHAGLRSLWRSAQRILNDAKRIFCVGFSFAANDPINFLLTSCQSRDTTLYIVDIDAQVPNKVAEFVPKSWKVSTQFFGPDWPEALVKWLWKNEPKDWGCPPVGDHPARTARLVRARLSEGAVLKPVGASNAEYRVNSVSEERIKLEDTSTGIPIVFNWNCLGTLAHHLAEISSPLPIVRATEEDRGYCVERLLQPWYSRKCGRLAASVLSHAGVVGLYNDDVILGLTAEYTALQC